MTVLYIAIDVGSSFIKSALLDLEGCRIVAKRNLPSPPRNRVGDPKAFEVSAYWYVEICRQLIDSYTTEYKAIEGVVLSTQMHGFVYVTKGREDTYISWQDMRCLNLLRGGGERCMEYLQRQFTPREMEKCGVYIKPSLGLCNLFALFDAEPELPRDGELFTLGSYILAKLTGNNWCHITNAAPLGLVDIEQKAWAAAILEKAGFGEVKLPRIVESDTEVCGTLFSSGISLPIFPDYGDQQIALLGCMAQPGEAIINVATAAQVSVTADAMHSGEYEVRPFFGNRYLNTISNMPAGRGLDVLVDFLKEAVQKVTGLTVETKDIWKAIQDDFVDDSMGLKVDTSFYARPGHLNGGAIAGITPSNLHLASLFSATFQDMADMYWRHIRILQQPEEIVGLVCAGGVSWKTPELLAAIRQVSGRPCRLSPFPDEAFAGLHRMALVCGGLCDSVDDRPEWVLSDTATIKGGD